MTGPLRSMGARLGRLGAVIRDSRGVAMVEMAFIAPVLLFLGVVGIEMANYAVTTMRISQAAMHIADNASRIGDRSSLSAQKIYESDINDLLIGVRIQAGTKVDLFENGRVILSSLEQNSDGGQWIHWQRCMGKKVVNSSYGAEGTGASGTSFAGMGQSGKEIKAGAGQAVMFVEIQYDYKPLLQTSVTTPFIPTAPISATSAFNVRNTRDLSKIHQRATPATVAACNKYVAI